MEWFEFPEFFHCLQITTYNKTKTVDCAVLDLLWLPIKDSVRFVCVKDGKNKYILMCSDLNLSAADIIKIYSYRSKIEVMFLYLKHLIGGFCYCFRTKRLPKISRKKTDEKPQMTASELKKAGRTLEAIERFLNLATIALGFLQYLSLTKPVEIWTGYHGWLRTRSSEYPSEQVVQTVIRSEFFASIWKVPFCATLRIVKAKIRRHLLHEALKI